MEKKPVWIAGIARGHNAGVCLLKDGEIVFAIEEERLTRQKYDCLLYTSPSPRDATLARMPSSA